VTSTGSRSIVAMMACHNRRESTVRCLSSLAGQTRTADLTVVLVDDGSTDGTAEAAAAAWPGISVIRGDGSLFWARAMALAEKQAKTARPDFLLWLNDDVALDDTALARLLDIHDRNADAAPIVVGAVRDPDTGAITYGGQRRVGRHPQRFASVAPGADAQDIDTFNGNVVLIPWRAALRVGDIDGGFPHAYADYDYGLRAKAMGVPMLLAPGTVGTCRANVRARLTGSLRARWRHIQSPKGMPWRAQVRYYRRHSGPEWPLYLAWSYAKRLFLGSTR
jgi:GT2 family glycosyltransferase